MSDEETRDPQGSVVIPAHNESKTISRLLNALTGENCGTQFDIVVVCNGCSDNTAAVAGSFGSSVRVVEIPQPSKREAQRTGDSVTNVFPRAYVDADVVITDADLERLFDSLTDGTLATAPRRFLNTAGAPWTVVRYYRFWERLPQVKEGLFGRGVVAVSRDGADRLSAIPGVLSDDLAMSDAFMPRERKIVRDSTVFIDVPRTTKDLIRRRIRVSTGSTQADQLGLRKESSITTVRGLAGIVARSPRTLPDLAIFLGVTIIARLGAHQHIRAGDYSTWLRDESTRR